MQSTRKVEELTEMVQSLKSEQKELQMTNEALLEDMRALKNESEEDKNYIEELKDQIGNYKLNARLKEVCAMFLWKIKHENECESMIIWETNGME